MPSDKIAGRLPENLSRMFCSEIENDKFADLSEHGDDNDRTDPDNAFLTCEHDQKGVLEAGRGGETGKPSAFQFRGVSSILSGFALCDSRPMGLWAG